jgi:predicted TIM-barrel fold metal-dependent hydrolase
MIEDSYVIDSVSHAYNVHPSNFAVPDAATAITLMVYGLASGSPPPYFVPPESWMRDWSVDEVASMLFRESATDFSVFHPTPISAYHDGMTSVEKAAEITQKWPTRFRTYATVDPLQGQAAVLELDRQMDLLNPIGLKLYPSSWTAGHHRGWRMDDPEVAFPILERARHHGLKAVAIHKAVPFGNVSMASYKIDDLDTVAHAFPDLNFEIVHGGVTFIEETAWLVGRFPNVYVNLEGVSMLLPQRPRLFASILLGLCQIGGPAVLDRLLWSSGCMAAHPRPLLEAFCSFSYPPDLLEASGLTYGALPPLSDDNKRGILGLNYARMHGLDIEELKFAAAQDEFARSAGDPLAEPYSTTASAAAV